MDFSICAHKVSFRKFIHIIIVKRFYTNNSSVSAPENWLKDQIESITFYPCPWLCLRLLQLELGLWYYRYIHILICLIDVILTIVTLNVCSYDYFAVFYDAVWSVMRQKSSNTSLSIKQLMI